MKLVALVCEKCSGDLEWEHLIPGAILVEGLTTKKITSVAEALEKARHENVMPVLAGAPGFKIIEPKYKTLWCKSCGRIYLLTNGALE